MSDDRVVFFDQFMTREKAEALQAAQREVCYCDDQQQYGRIPYGDEKFRVPYEADSSPCRYCGTIQGKLHRAGCEHEQCPKCGAQRITCDCQFLGQEPPQEEGDR